MAKGERGEEFARGTGADGGVVFERNDLLEEPDVVRREPSEAKTRKTIAFADGAETEGAVVEVRSRRQTRGGIVLQFSIDFIGENVDAVARGTFEDGIEDRPRHQETRGIVGRVDIDRASVRTDKGFESAEVMSPAVRGFATPFADGGAGADGNAGATFVAGGLDDGVIVGS